VAFDGFPNLAGLRRGEYSAGDKPNTPGYKVIMPIRKANVSRWRPRELDPLAFEFSAENGLVEISGFLRKGETQEAVLGVLTQRYERPSRALRALNMVTYVWDFDKSVLELSSVIFRLYLANKSKR